VKVLERIYIKRYCTYCQCVFVCTIFFRFLSHFLHYRKFILVLDFGSQVHDAVLMNVYLDVRNPGGSGFWNEGYMGKEREMKRSVYKQPETKVDGSCHS
jgi:hypothetical protein